MHAEFLGHAADHGLRLGGPVHPYRTLAQLQRVLPRGRHRLGSSHETHLTCCHLSPHLGGTSADDESILVDLQRVPVHIDQIVFTVNSFTGQAFQDVQNAFCRLVDEADGQELARYTLDGGGQHTAQIMAKAHRAGASWRMTAIGAPAHGRTFQDLMPAILPHL
nr:TerD family protein [Streptomyces europaeiscabiei]